MQNETTLNRHRIRSKDLMVWVSLMVLVLWSCEVPSTNAGDREQASTIQHRLVMHLNSGDEKVQKGALNNIRHLYEELRPEQLRVELVVHGAGLTLFTKKDTTLGEELSPHYSRTVSVRE